MKEDDSNRIERYITGVANENEIKMVESLFLNGEDNSKLRKLLEKDWDNFLNDTDTSSPEANLSHLLERVHRIIRKQEVQKRQKPLQKFIRIYMKAAAFLLLPLLLAEGLLFIYPGNKTMTINDRPVSTTIYAPLGARVSFNLPDGTKGMLNSGSHLSYSLPFNSNREVSLDGEAWFEVIHDVNHPFRISTGNSTLRVLGTSFNLSAYPAENYIEVVLQQGEVEFRDSKGDEYVTILPSERLIFQNGNIDKSVVEPAKYYAWTEGKLVFRGDPMAEVGRRIERWYNVKFDLADKDLEKYSFRATFEDDNLEEVLRFLSMTSPIRYRITPRKLLPDGTYEKEKVTIYMKK